MAVASVVAQPEPHPAGTADNQADNPAEGIVVEGMAAGAFAAWGRPADLALVEPFQAGNSRAVQIAETAPVVVDREMPRRAAVAAGPQLGPVRPVQPAAWLQPICFFSFLV